MRSKLKERLARLGPVQGVGRVVSGSPVAVVLRPGRERPEVDAIAATLALARRGMTMLRSKRAIEYMLERGEVAVDVPTVEDMPDFAGALRDAGVDATPIATHGVDVRALRERLGMSQEQFARRYGLDLDAVQNWEQRRRPLEGAALSYLRVIEAFPEAAARAQEDRAFLREAV